MQKEEIQDLVKKYLNDTATIEERECLSDWYKSQDIENVEWLAEVNNEEALVKASMLDYIQKHTIPDRSKSVSLRLFRFIGAAAAILLVLGIGLYFFNSKYPLIPIERLASSKNDVLPGGNKAILTLASGKQISLTDAGNGKLAEQAGIVITKTNDGQLVYIPKDPGLHENESLLNNITTPKGGTYKLTLSDGTLVILNAASTLKFPATFASLKERKVELIGEAYFVVKHNARQPFRVTTKGQVVEDIGTEFNINAYTDENTIKTTLIEGSARVVPIHLNSPLRNSEPNPEFSSGSESRNRKAIISDNNVVLKPGQQSSLTNTGNIQVSSVDSEEVAAWKNGLFIFNEETLESIMRKVSRWYNLEVEYEDPSVKNLTFGGRVSRFDKVSKVLYLMEKAGNVHFKIEGRKIKVSN